MMDYKNVFNFTSFQIHEYEIRTQLWYIFR